MKNVFILMTLCIPLISCNNKAENATEVKPYFDLKKYFSQQADLLNKEQAQLKKRMTKDGKTEEKLFTQLDWQQELKPFSDCDINKPSWVHSYFADTNFKEGEMRIKYIAKDVSLPVKQLTLSFENNQLKRMYIDKESANSYYYSKNTYAYIPSEGFTINGSQEVMLARKTDYSIVAMFIK